jgi:hypothetical protein
MSPPHEACDSPDEAAHYRTLGPKLGTLSLTRQLARKEERSILLLYFMNLLILPNNEF